MNDQNDFIDNFLNTFDKNTTPNDLKDRMKTVILKAKHGDKKNFVNILAADYIRVSKEL